MSPEKTSSNIPIRPEKFLRHKDNVTAKLKSVRWRPSNRATSVSTPNRVSLNEFSSTTIGTPEAEVKIIDLIKSLCGESTELINPNASLVLDSVRTGIMVGLEVMAAYSKSSGFDVLMTHNERGTLAMGQRDEFAQKRDASCLIFMFATASYICWKLGSSRSEKGNLVGESFEGIPEVSFSNYVSSMQCMLYYYGWYLEQGKVVRNEHDLVEFTIVYFEKLLDDLIQRLPGIRFTEPFSDASFQLEGTDFVLSGFHKPSSIVVESYEFNSVNFKEIVGNRAAKHRAQRIARRLACYDPEQKDNPWRVLGGMDTISMGFGKPGTGKSLQIAATATVLRDLCERRGVAFEVACINLGSQGTPSFLFHPLPDNIVSTFQGGSAEHMMAWMRRLQDSDKIIYAPIDDGENNLEDRGRRGISAGVREIIGVFLRYTEGAYAINRGNWIIDIMTNLPEQVDKAVLSRVRSRFPIDGATNQRDFIDQDYLWWQGLREISEELVDFVPDPEYQFLDDQDDLSSLSEIETGEVEISDWRLRKIVEETRKLYGLNDVRFFGMLYYQMQQSFPGFTSRDVRNIQSAVTRRLMDFDTPDEWFDNPELFFAKSFDERVEVLRDLMRQNVKGMSLSDIQYREAIKYLDNVSRIEGIEEEREIDRLLEQASIRVRARELAAQKGIPEQLVF